MNTNRNMNRGEKKKSLYKSELQGKEGEGDGCGAWDRPGREPRDEWGAGGIGVGVLALHREGRFRGTGKKKYFHLKKCGGGFFYYFFTRIFFLPLPFIGPPSNPALSLKLLLKLARHL